MSEAQVKEDAHPGKDDGEAGEDADGYEEILGDDAQLRLGVHAIFRRSVSWG